MTTGQSLDPKHRQALRILFVEDNQRDVKLMTAILEQAGYDLDFVAVDTPALLQREMGVGHYEIVISDYNLRGWTALEALEIVKSTGRDIPVVVVSGSLGDEAAAYCIKQGAADYVLKDRMARLPSAIQHALEEKRLRGTQSLMEAQRRSIIEGAPYGIYRSTQAGQILMTNPALVRMLGYESEEEILRLNSIQDIYADPAERQRVVERFQLGDAIGVETVWKQKNGKPLFVSLYGRSVHRPEDGSLVYEVFVENTTERRSLEQQYRQAQKMEAVGRLAGGIAHDFNNLLSIITGYSDLLLEQYRTGDPLMLRKLEAIKKAGESAAGLTRQLLAFSRKQVLELKDLDLSAVVKETSSMLLRLLGEDIQLLTGLSPGLGAIQADRSQIEQIIMNLAVNARDAMPQGGNLMLETANVELDESYVQQHLQVSSGPYVMLAVSDSGVGMTEEVQRQIFEPFFTTKEKDKGTGLGLATVYGIVKQSGGCIWVYSEVGKGTTFKIYFPRIQSQDTFKVAESKETIGTLPSGSETVLLVEDAASLREMNSEVLDSLGYTVLNAGHGTEALRIAEQHRGPIHLLLTDVVMPGMNGRELAENLKSIHPECKVLFVSGYTDSIIAEHGVLEPGVAFLQKPFTRASMAQKVREVLDRETVPYP